VDSRAGAHEGREPRQSLESAILDAGYRGLINREQGTIVVLNEEVPVQY
jgi:hypothetical protein